ncbi:PRP38 family-domain-containing protein [Ephemerocybe angulata]|uniref:Pre-mRNA-splicing factor 38 n=1 Tax=Ephemerocybe angulata TaxID=980116 RepID=A0A8H6IHB5_9AGAR|nr:PRP38 family-domain-containing protein [Tulosesus angulatus]
MANTTVTGAKSIHGQNPQFLVETVIRNRIYDSSFWKEHCFALTAETIIDKALEVKYIGGVYGNQRPTEFICLLLKLLQIQPEKEILVEYLRADEFKYLRALAALYIRMTFEAVEVYELLEPLMKDYRKLRQRSMAGYSLTFIDEFVDALLTEERVCDLILPRMQRRQILEENGDIGPRKSRLLDAMEDKDEKSDAGSYRSRSRSRSWSRSPRPSRSVSRGRSRSRSQSGARSGASSPGSNRSRSRSRSSAGSRYVSRSPSRSRSGSRSPSHRSISPDRMDTGN